MLFARVIKKIFLHQSVSNSCQTHWYQGVVPGFQVTGNFKRRF